MGLTHAQNGRSGFWRQTDQVIGKRSASEAEGEQEWLSYLKVVSKTASQKVKLLTANVRRIEEKNGNTKT
jgi:hypothetical protein